MKTTNVHKKNPNKTKAIGTENGSVLLYSCRGTLEA